jgi:hypothetical protein
MPSPLDERFQPYRNKHVAAAALFDRAAGICADLKLKRIEVDSNKRLAQFGKQEELQQFANESAIRWNGHKRTVDALTIANDGAKARLRDEVFSPGNVKMPVEWRVEAFRHVDAAGGDGSKLMAENPDLLGVVYNAPIPLSRVPRAEVERLADDHATKVRPAEAEHIASEAQALETVRAQLSMAEDAIRGASGHGGDIAGFTSWLNQPERQPTPETQRALTSEIAKVESAAILRSAAAWDEADRKKLWDDLMNVRIEQM